MALTRPKIWDIDTNIAFFTDAITVLHQGASTANVDVGFLMNRANGLISNVALYWNEAGNTFVTAFTTDSGMVNSNISVSNYANLATGSITVSGPIVPTANMVYDLGTPTMRFGSMYLSGNTIDLSGASISSTPSALTLQNPAGGSFSVTGTVPGQSTGTFGNLIANSGVLSASTTTGALVVAGGVGISESVHVGGTIFASTINAATIGNSGAVLYGTLNSSSASQPNITTLGGVTSLGTTGATTTAAGNFTVSGNLTVNGTTNTINNTIYETTEYVQNIYANSVNATTIGNIGANVIGTGTYLTALDASNLSSGTISGSILGNSTLHIGTTTIALNRASASQSLTGVSIDGTASNITEYTINQNVGTSNSPVFSGLTANGTIIAATINAATIGNSGAVLTGTLSTTSQPNVTSLGTLTGLTVSGNTAINSTLYGYALYDAGKRVVTTSTGSGNLTILVDAINLTTTGPGVATTGSSTAIPVITTDAYGRIESISTTAVIAPAGTLTGSTLASGVTNSSLTSVGTLTGLTVSGTIVAPTINAATIGNSGAVLYGTLNSSSASQPNITTLGGVTSIGASSSTTITGTLQTSSQPNITSTGTLTGLTVYSPIGGYFANISAVAAIEHGGIQTWKFYTNTNASAPGSWILFPDNTQQNTAYPGSATALSLSGVVNAGTLVATNVNAATIGNSGAVLYGTLNSSSASQPNITTLGGVTSLGTTGATTTAAGNFTVSGNLTVNGTTNTINNTIYETTEYVQNIYANSVNATTIGNIGANVIGTGTYLTALDASNLSSGTIPSAQVSGPYTGITAVGTVTGLTSSGIIQVTNNTQNSGTSYSSGALQVTGGAGIGGNLYVTGNAIIAGNISLTGNINTVVVTGNSAQFFGNASGFGALYAGISSGYVVQPQTVLQASTNFNGYAQINHQNINADSLASTDYIATADNGNATDTYIDMGIASSTYDYPGFGIIRPNDGYLLVQGNATTGGGNLVLTSGLNDIVFVPGGSNANNEFGRITASNVFVIKSTNSSISSTTGALQVAGGVGVAGAVYAGSVYDNNNRVLTSLSSSGTGNVTVSVNAPTGTTVALTTTGPGVATTGSSTAIPVITTDAYGRIEGISTAAVIAPAGTLTGSTLASVVTNSSLTSVGTLTGLTVSGITSLNSVTTGTLTSSSTINAATLQAETIGNVGATFTGLSLALTNWANIAGNLLVSGYGHFSGQFDESSTVAGMFVGNTGIPGALSPAVGFFNGNTSQNWQIDNSNGTLRWVTPGITRMSLDSGTSQLNVSGNVVTQGGIYTTTGLFWAGNNNVISTGGGGSAPAGLTGQIQYNNGGTLGATSLYYFSGNSVISTVGNIVADQVHASSTGTGTNFKVGVDAWIGDISVNNTISVRGQQDATQGYIVFGNSNNTNYIGRSGTNPITVTGAFSVTGNTAVTSTIYGQGIYDDSNRVVSTSSGAGNLTISGTSINLTTTGPGATTVGSSTSIPVITTDVYGRVVGLSSSSVSTTINLAGTSGTGSVAGSGTLTFAGSNGFTASVSGSTITLSDPQNLQASASPVFSGLTINGTVVASAINAATIGNASAVLYGTLNSSSASQTNITTVGNLTSLSVSGVSNRGGKSLITNFTGTAAPANPQPGDEWWYTTGNVLYKYINDGSANSWVSISSALFNASTAATPNTLALRDTSGNLTATNFIGVASSAKYADLAEIYVSDSEYSPGTVVVFGGEQEVTVTNKSHDTRVAGVISTNPAYLMNSDCNGLPVAFTGRVPCRVIGPVKKGDVLVSSDIHGVAQRLNVDRYSPGCILGKSLENIVTSDIQTIEVVVGRF